jgi:hypothetical protein
VLQGCQNRWLRTNCINDFCSSLANPLTPCGSKDHCYVKNIIFWTIVVFLFMDRNVTHDDEIWVHCSVTLANLTPIKCHYALTSIRSDRLLLILVSCFYIRTLRKSSNLLYKCKHEMSISPVCRINWASDGTM